MAKIFQYPFFLLCALILLNAFSNKAQPSYNKDSDEIILEIGDESVKKEEFKYIYEKNNSDDPNLYSKESLKDYLDLYTKFKLKVKAAEKAGIDTTKQFKKEFQKYRDQLANPYLTNDSIMENLVEEAYNRKMQLIKAKHLTIRVPKGAPTKDTQNAYETLKTIQKKLERGKEFKSMVKAYQDQTKYGKLGYFTVFDQPYPIENAAYSTPEGETTGIVRSKHGYHLLKITEKKPYQGKVRASHIMVKPKKQKNDTANWERAEKLIKEAYKQLKGGESFADVVAEYSEDRRSKSNDGKLPPFDRLTRHFPDKFKNKAFRLDEKGAYTKPFKTRYGYHIVKRRGMKKPDSLNKMREDLVKEIKKKPRYDKVKRSVVKDIKQSSGYTQINKPDNLQKHFDSSLLKGHWTMDGKSGLDKKLFKIGDKQLSAIDFARYIENNQKKKPPFNDITALLKYYYKQFEQKEILAYEKRHLDEKYPEFRNLIREYKDGILLFEIMDQKVWSKAVNDTNGLKEYHKSNRSKYQRPLTKVGYFFECNDKSTQKSIASKVKNGKKPATIRENLAGKGAEISLTYDSFRKNENPVIKQTKNEKGIYTKKHNGKFYVIKIDKIKPAGLAPLETVRGKVVADYQEHLEETWIKNLKQKYPVKIHDDVLESLYKE